MTKEEQHATLLSAMGLLLDRQLEWSSDFYNIKPALCMVLHEGLIAKEPDDYIVLLAERIIEAHG